MENFLLSFFLLLPIFGESQTDHYETIVNEEDNWAYFVGEFEPPADWKELNFDDSDWQVGKGGFGYADDDDRTIIPATVSLYIRPIFTIFDKKKALLFYHFFHHLTVFPFQMNQVNTAR